MAENSGGFKRYTQEEMDGFADEANSDLVDVSDDVILSIGEFWNKWYMKVGHRRLGRMLLSIYKDLSNK